MTDTARFDARRRVPLAEAAGRLPGSLGERFCTVFTHGSLKVELYAPRGSDDQSVHDRDEVYVVAAGHGTFTCAGQRQPFVTGDLLFAPAGVQHRFVEFSADFLTWVLFYGPRGGEHVVR